MPPNSNTASVADNEGFHMTTRRRAQKVDSAEPTKASPPSPVPASGPEPSRDGGASRGRVGRLPGRGRGSSHVARSGGQGGGRGRGGRAWRAWGGAPPKRGTHVGFHIALQYVDPKEEEEPPQEWTEPEREALEARMEDLDGAYREVLATLKPALAELANRTQGKLKANNSYLWNNMDYINLLEDLDKRFHEEIKIIEAKQKLELEEEEQRGAEGRELIIDEYTAKVDGMRDAYSTHIKLETMRLIRIFERKGISEEDNKGPDEYKNLVNVPNSRLLARPRGDRDTPGNARFYYNVDAIWEDWQQRTVDEPETRHLPRPFEQIAGPKRSAAASGWQSTPHYKYYAI